METLGDVPDEPDHFTDSEEEDEEVSQKSVLENVEDESAGGDGQTEEIMPSPEINIDKDCSKGDNKSTAALIDNEINN